MPEEAFTNGKLELTLDRTNWKFGPTTINILMLAVIYKGVALPLLFTFLVQIGSNWVYLSGLKFINDKGKTEFLIVASYSEQDNQIALKIYQKRWQIETIFKAFKTAGFNLENTHLTDYQRLNKLLLIAAIAFIWACKVGIYRHNNIKKIDIKKHGRPAQSLFAYGLEFLAQALINGFTKKILLLTIAFLSCI